MLAFPGSALQTVRAFGRRFFHQFGIHCATHQIRVILISAVVITSLLFPAIALYSSSHTHFFAITLRVLDSFLTPDEFSSYFAQDDLRHLWEGYDALRAREDSLARARCGSDAIFRAERVLVHRVSQDEDFSPINRRTLLSTLDLERRIYEVLSERGLPCLTTRDGRCFSLSPLAFWNYNDAAVFSDQNLADTLTLSKNVSLFGITITPEMVLAGREDVGGSGVDSATFLALTYFFPDTDCSNNAGHFAWLRALEEATESVGDLITQTHVPRLIALEYDKPNQHPSILSVFSYVAYMAFLVYFYYTMKRMDTVHSRIGLAFTGIVEILVSTVTSLSVCALAGFRITMIPWEIFPIVVIFIGVENMFSIVDAVVKTSVALPVKLRIAEGLGRAGTSNTLKLVSYNTVLGLIAAFSSGAIRQFSAFAIVVLVAHWFLVHTFFVTVLSIDIQRLELDELLRQNSSLAPTVPEAMRSPAKSPKTLSARLAVSAQSLLRGRATKNISLLLLLAITATLYYATYPGQTRFKTEHDPPLLRNSKNRSIKYPIQEGVSPALHVWQLLNPTNDEMVHIRVETPTILLMGNIPSMDSEPDKTRHLGADHDKISRSRCPWLTRLWMRTMRPLAWFIKIVVMPITVTTVLLYGLLLYLLKDADLLEAQRNRAEPDSPVKEEVPPPVEGKIVFTTLPRAFATDVDLIAANKTGTVVVAIGLQNELVMWRADTQSFTAIDTSDLLLGSSASTPTPAATLTAVAVNEKGTFCAVGTGSGVIAIWSLSKNFVKPLPHLVVDSTISAVTHIEFASNSTIETGRSTPIRTRTTSQLDMSPGALGNIFATYENGAAIKWTVTSFAVPTYITPSQSASVVKSMLLPVQADGRLLICFSLDDGSIELCDLESADGILPNECCVTAGNPSDLVTKVNVCQVELEGTTHLIVGAATQAGVVSLWDAHTGECMFIVDELFGEVNCLKITPVTTRVCPHCGELPLENFLLSFSVGQIVVFYRIYLSVPTRRCSCVQNQLPQTLRSNIIGRRSRSGSSTSTSGTITPTHSRSRVPSFSSMSSAFETNMFPVSGHGVHSRRASEKGSIRRDLDTFVVSDFDDMDTHPPIGPPDFNPSSGFLQADHRSSLWQNLVVVRTGDARFERGGWDVADDGKIIGIRRKQRLAGVLNGRCNGSLAVTAKMLRPQEASTTVGLTNSTLERWELWTYCPSTSTLQASPLATLQHGPPTFHPTHSTTSSSASSSSSTSSSSSSVSSSPACRDVRVLPPSPTSSNHSILANSKRRIGGDTIPRLHFTRVSPFIGSRSFCVAGFGNTVGVFTLASAHSRPKQPSIESLRDASNQIF